MDPRREARRGELKENDLVFVTNGCLVENSARGDHRTPATFNSEIRAGEHLGTVAQYCNEDLAFGRPNKFCTHTDQSTRTLVGVVV